MDQPLNLQPQFSIESAADIAREHFGRDGEVSSLPSERDQNFKITAADGQAFVLKIANPQTPPSLIELENAAIQIAFAISSFESPQLIRTLANSTTTTVRDPGGHDCLVRMISFLSGNPLAQEAQLAPSKSFLLGQSLAELDVGLTNLNQHSAAKREFLWDLRNAPAVIRKAISQGTDWFAVDDQNDAASKISLLKFFLAEFEKVESRIADLPCSVIHNDANDYNILVRDPNPLLKESSIALLDFGDLMWTTQINELAIAAAYLLLRDDWMGQIEAITSGYHDARPLSGNELSVLFPLMTMRLCQSVCIANAQRKSKPENEYLGVTEEPAWSALKRLRDENFSDWQLKLTAACFGSQADETKQQDNSGRVVNPIHYKRNELIGPSLSLSYETPLHIVRGKGQYLFDPADGTYLDCVNNVCHVGHCHPKVVAAIEQQASLLNTNTRYLHENLIQYAERLTALLPEQLQVCYFVNSGSEANDLALRMAKACNSGTETVVIDHAYHGHTSALIDLSPYKFKRSGGQGKPEHVHLLSMPDGYRGDHRREHVDWIERYVGEARDTIQSAAQTGRGINAFFAESWLGCGGQVPLPPGYLAPLYDTVRAAGGVCVADEVQVGFGRLGEHFWGFEFQNVVPDIVTMGKPIGNGHPLAAVVTTRKVADAFNNGMEYFNTFGGNPVSCAVGLAVLDVIESEQLQRHALDVGKQILRGLNDLQSEFECLGDVRGSGLFLGIELVDDPAKRTPNAELAKRVVESMKDRRILLSTDGPDENVIKFKPPLVFSAGDAERLVLTLREVLQKL
ncbi:MAG: aminotransferase class III-fold pyridoxal phosphate-dependent enzyme [Planctomycetota bacterium]